MNRMSFVGSRLCLGAGLALAMAGLVASPLRAEEAPRPASGSGRDEVRASHILVGSKDEADAIRKEIVAAGGNRQAFVAAARKHSKDVTTKPLGGDVNWFRQGGVMEKAFTDAAFALRVGEMSEAVQTPFGWHLLFVTDRREIGSDRPAPPPPPPPADPSTKTLVPGEQPQTAGAGQVQPPKDEHDHDHDHPEEAKPGTPAGTAGTPPPPRPAVEAKRTILTDNVDFRLSIETVRSQKLSLQQASFTPDQAIEVNLTLKNQSSKEQKFVARELLPLGLKVTVLGDTTPLPGDFASLQEPAALFATYKTYEISGIEVSLNDYWKGLAQKRYSVSWDLATLIANLEQRFAKVKDQADYSALSELSKRRNAVSVDVVNRDVSPRITMQRSRPLNVSVYEPLKTDGKTYVQIKFANPGEQILIELAADKQYSAVNHFVKLVTEGFYDGLGFFDQEAGDYVLGGCPTNSGTGAPSFSLPRMKNDAKLTHKRGTVSFVTRSTRQKGPAPGGQVGSIFVVCLKAHPEWDEEHVPFGEVVSGLELLDKTGLKNFREVSVVGEADLGNLKPTPAAAADAVAGNPEAVIKTSKGVLTVELFEDVARNTVANFVTLAGQKFYDKLSKGDGKQKLFVMKDDTGSPFIIQTGSPTNELDPSSGPGYSIPSEINAKKHVKGAVAMCVAYDEATKAYVPDTSGSQFFICTKELPYYDFLRSFTVFGQVTSGLDVLDRLTDADTIESVEITKKKPHPYTVRKVASP